MAHFHPKLNQLWTVTVSLTGPIITHCLRGWYNWTEQNRTNLYSTKMSTICGKERIQHDLTNCLDPSLRLNCYHGDPGNNELIVYYMAISEKQRTVNIDNLTASAAPQIVKKTTYRATKNVKNRQSDDPVSSVINNATWLDSWERMNASI